MHRRRLLVAFLSLLSRAAAPLSADAILMLRPIDVCDSSTLVCGDPTEQLFSQATEDIWQQAGITIDFLSWAQVHAPASDYTDLDPPGVGGGSAANRARRRPVERARSSKQQANNRRPTRQDGDRTDSPGANCRA